MPQNIVGTVWADAAGTQERTLTHAANGGESNSVGTDLFVKYNENLYALWGSYSYTDSKTEYGSTTVGLNKVSQHNVRVGVTLKATSNFTSTVSYSWASTPRNLELTNVALNRQIKNPSQMNLNLIYALNNFEVFSSTTNVLNRQILSRGVLDVSPQERFRTIAGVTYRF